MTEHVPGRYLLHYQHATGLLQDWAATMRLALDADRQVGDDRGQST